MKTGVIAVLVIVVLVLGYGIFGASKADELSYTCTAEVGPLCFAWKKNAIGNMKDGINDLLDKAKEAAE